MSESQTISTHVHAEPGYMVVQPVTGADGRCFDLLRQPVLAWLVETDILETACGREVTSVATPITFNYLMGFPLVIQSPDGSMEAIDDCEILSDDDCIEHFNLAIAHDRAHRNK